jgi:MFS family permease
MSERTMWIGATVVSSMLFGVAFSPWLSLTAIMLFALGAGSNSFSSTAMTRMQLAAPAELRGRVMSLVSLLWIGTGPFGSMLLGTLSEHFGVRQALSTSALLSGLGVVAGAIYVSRRFRTRDALRAGGEPDPAGMLAEQQVSPVPFSESGRARI